MISIITLSFIIGQTFIAIYLFSVLKRKDDFEKTLSAILTILFFHLGAKFFILVVLKDSFLYENNASGFGLSYGPLLYIATHIFLKKPLTTRPVFYHMAPFVLGTLVYFVNSGGYLFHAISPTFINDYAFVYQWFVGASLLVYPLLSIILLIKNGYDHKIPAVFQSKLLKNIAVVILAGMVTSVFAVTIHYVKTGNRDFDIRLIPYICLAVIPVLILRYKMQDIISPDNKAIPVQKRKPTTENNVIVSIEKRYKKSALDEQMMDKYESSLKKFIEKTKIYLEPEISLEELSAKSGIPKHHLTQLLNERFQKNFYSFINEYRIAEAIEKLKRSDASINILSLAYDCGFNSKSSFNNYFKKVTGFTPSAYRKEHNLQPLNEAMITP